MAITSTRTCRSVVNDTGPAPLAGRISVDAGLLHAHATSAARFARGNFCRHRPRSDLAREEYIRAARRPAPRPEAIPLQPGAGNRSIHTLSIDAPGSPLTKHVHRQDIPFVIPGTFAKPRWFPRLLPSGASLQVRSRLTLLARRQEHQQAFSEHQAHEFDLLGGNRYIHISSCTLAPLASAVHCIVVVSVLAGSRSIYTLLYGVCCVSGGSGVWPLGINSSVPVIWLRACRHSGVR